MTQDNAAPPPSGQLSRGEQTRARLMDLAEAAILEKGYAATSIDELIAAAGITKSGFFYHFPEKADLAQALLHREKDRTLAVLEASFADAEAAHADPRDALFAGFAAFARAMAEDGGPPGCLVAAFAYQEGQFGEAHRALMHETVHGRRAALRKRLARAAERYPPRAGIDLDDLADMALAVIQGGMVLDRVRERVSVTSQQIALYTTFLRAVFSAPPQSGG